MYEIKYLSLFFFCKYILSMTLKQEHQCYQGISLLFSLFFMMSLSCQLKIMMASCIYLHTLLHATCWHIHNSKCGKWIHQSNMIRWQCNPENILWLRLFRHQPVRHTACLGNIYMFVFCFLFVDWIIMILGIF